MTEGPEGHEFRRLQAAVDAFLAWEAGETGGSWEDLLERHADLRDLLVPMRAESPADEPAGPAAAGPVRRLGPYELVREIGRGGMGVVFEARDVALHRTVALKVLPDHVTRDPATVARFRREAALCGKLAHPSIVRVHGFGAVDATHFIAMEFVVGAPLDRVLRRLSEVPDAQRDGAAFAAAVRAELHRPGDRQVVDADPTRGRRTLVEIVVDLIARIADALDHAHRHGIVHRDVKPANVMIRLDGEIALTDFGLAKEPGRPSMTLSGTFAGTPHYVAPEQVAAGRRDVDARTDVFSLGASLYEALTFTLPFDGDDPREVLAKIVSHDPVDPQRLAPRIAPDLAAIVMKALEKEPHHRYASAAELAEDLRAFLDYRPVRARRRGAWSRTLRFVRRRPLVASLAGVALLAILVGSTVSWILWLRAEWNAQLVAKKVEEFEMLATIVHLREARAAERSLHPAWPERTAAMEAWLAGPWARVERALPAVAAMRDELVRRLSAAPPDETPTARDAEQQLLTLLSGLLTDAERFSEHEVARVRERLDWSRRVAELSIDRHRERWAEAREALRTADGIRASTLYRSDPPLDLEPQIGLVPIGKNPRTGLWEFYHLRSAADPEQVPVHAADGSIAVGEGTGIVFVLVPGGRWTIGAQADDPDAPWFDPWTEPEDVPHVVELAPFFIARHELTQAQWERLTGSPAPNFFATGGSDLLGGTVTAAHPVDRLAWFQAAEALVPHGLALPTEAQWEVACRAGTDTTWWTGNDRDSLLEGGPAVNIADAAAARAGSLWAAANDWSDYDDGYCIHAPVDSLRPNPWGLHHVLGNVWEWCRDQGLDYRIPVRSGDGLREPPGPVERERRILRGGDMTATPNTARCAMREALEPSTAADGLGVRASRALH